MEKLSKNKLYFIIVAAIALVALVLVITASTVSYSNAKKAINDIGFIGYNDNTKSKIDDAQHKYELFQKGIGATTTFTSINEKVGYVTLQKAKATYLEAAIRDVNDKYISGATEDAIKAELKTIRQTIDEYFANKDYSLISNYATFTSLETKYGAGASDNQSQSGSQQAAEEPEIC